MRWGGIGRLPLVAFAGLALSTNGASAASEGCQALVQAAATGAAAQMKADDYLIQMPQSVTKFTCLDSFYNGTGMDLVSDGLDPAAIARKVAGKICSQVSAAWSSMQGSAECGLTLTGPDTNFDLGLGSGTVCPTVNFGGGGDTLISTGTNGTGTNHWDVGSALQLPNGYTLSDAAKAFGLLGGD